MAIKPILFNTEMVRAIRDGRKTQTRRIIKPQPVWDGISCHYISKYGCWAEQIPIARDNWPIKIGDILWVRETWHKDAGRYMYKANYSEDEKFYRNGKEVEIRWRPSIHMPKEAARTFLLVKDVRCEKLQDIYYKYEPGPDHPVSKEGCRYLCDFIAVWDSTIKPSDRARSRKDGETMKLLFEMIRQAIKDQLDRMNKWSAEVNARERAYRDLADVTSRRYAKDIRFLAEQLEPYGYDPTLLIELAYLKAHTGHSLIDIKGKLLMMLDECERKKQP